MQNCAEFRLEVVDAPIPDEIMPTYKMNMKGIPAVTGELGIKRGNYPSGTETYILMNKVDNEEGKIDYAVGVLKPETEDKGVLAVVPFRIKSSDAYSKISFDFEEEANRQSMFIERIKPATENELPVDVQPQVDDAEVIIKVPAVFNDLNNVVVYPNPAYKDKHPYITFSNLTNTNKQVTLRIYTLSGELVIEKTKEKVNDSQIKWDLKNKEGEYVASGIYIYFLKDEQGSTTRGKIGVIK